MFTLWLTCSEHMLGFISSLTHIYCNLLYLTSVVATTHRNSTCSLLTSAKLSIGYLVLGIYKRTRQGALAALLLYLYKYNVVHATTMCLPHVLLLIHHASYMCLDIILLISIVHVHTMCIPRGTIVP